MVVEPLPHQPNFKGFFPATIADTGELKGFTNISLMGQPGGYTFALLT
jgi:hypothetical protein